MNGHQNLLKAFGQTDFLKFLLFDILIATILGFVAWTVTRDSISSFLISLVLALVLLIGELRFQLVMTRQDVIAAIDMGKEVSTDAFLYKQLSSAAGVYAVIQKTQDQLFIGRSQKLICDCVEQLRELREGCMRIGPEDHYSIGIARSKELKSSYFATSFAGTTDFWLKGGGKQYFHENAAAVARGVELTRVFIVESEWDLTDEVKRVISSQIDAGMNVLIAFEERLVPELLYDIAIWDNMHVSYLDLVPGSKRMRGARWYGTSAELEKGKRMKEQILRESEDAAAVLERISRTRGAANDSSSV